jgi:hypothetical protein
LCFGAESLNGIHQLQRLIRERFPQLGRPPQFVAHVLNHRWELRHSSHILIPRLIINRREVVGVGCHKACRLDNFLGINRRRQHDRNQRIRIKRHRRDQFLQIGRAALGRL